MTRSNNTLRIYCSEGNDPFTAYVDLSEAETHIAANDQLSGESKLLLEFSQLDKIPDTLGDGQWKYDGEGSDELGYYYQYGRVED
jgi:hypothetical protein